KIDNGLFKRIGINLVIFLALYILPSHTILVPLFIGLLFHYHVKNRCELIILLGIYSLCTNSELVYYTYSFTLAIIVIFDKTRIHNNSNHIKILRKYRILISYLFVVYIFQMFSGG